MFVVDATLCVADEEASLSFVRAQERPQAGPIFKLRLWPLRDLQAHIILHALKLRVLFADAVNSGELYARRHLLGDIMFEHECVLQASHPRLIDGHQGTLEVVGKGERWSKKVREA